MLRVYLAGPVRGTKGDWREQIPEIPNVCFMHPGAALPGPREELRSEIYAPANGHWTPLGHRVAAEQIVDFLRASGLVQ